MSLHVPKYSLFSFVSRKTKGLIPRMLERLVILRIQNNFSQMSNTLVCLKFTKSFIFAEIPYPIIFDQMSPKKSIQNFLQLFSSRPVAPTSKAVVSNCLYFNGTWE